MTIALRLPSQSEGSVCFRHINRVRENKYKLNGSREILTVLQARMTTVCRIQLIITDFVDNAKQELF